MPGLEVIQQKRWKITVLEREKVVFAVFLTAISDLHQRLSGVVCVVGGVPVLVSGDCFDFTRQF